MRAKTVLRRTGVVPKAGLKITFGDVVVDVDKREVTKAGEDVRLTVREFDLLVFLATNPRQVFSRSHLLARVWGDEFSLDAATVTVHVRRLREKVEDDPSTPLHLETVWGVGYRFTP